MEKRRSLSLYRLIDTAIWLALMLVFESLVVRAALKWFPAQAYYVSVVPAIAAIVYMRWGAWGVIHAVLGGAVTGLMMGFGKDGILIYMLGNALSVLAVGLIKLFGSESLRKDVLKTLLYGLTVFVLMLAGKALVAVALGSPIKQAFTAFAPEVVILLFTEVILWIARRLDGVFEPQAHYVRRVQQEQEQERGENP
ncbi:MAG: hypothetical protein IJM56_07685 [Clostridia bacterium]|nr:hypothetical protein [Clostridia bacterium]